MTYVAPKVESLLDQGSLDFYPLWFPIVAPLPPVTWYVVVDDPIQN